MRTKTDGTKPQVNKSSPVLVAIRAKMAGDGVTIFLQESCLLFEEVGAILSGCNPIPAEIVRDTVMLLAIAGVARVLNGLATLVVAVMNWVVTVTGLVLSIWKSEPGPNCGRPTCGVGCHNRYCCKSP